MTDVIVDRRPTTEWDIVARREALCLELPEVADLFKVDSIRYSEIEAGLRRAPALLVDDFGAMEDWVEDLATDLVENGRPLADDQLEYALTRVRTDDAATTAYKYRFPDTLAYTAIGRAAATLKARGLDAGRPAGPATIHELVAARMACGMNKRIAAIALRMKPAQYSQLEKPRPVPIPDGILAELQQMAEWIENAIPGIIAAATPPAGPDSDPTVWLYDEWDTWKAEQPDAASPAGKTYPLRISHVATARAAARLALDTPASGDPAETHYRPQRATVRIDEIANRKN